jgi:Tfp pilus assembly PilM family ATPase
LSKHKEDKRVGIALLTRGSGTDIVRAVAASAELSKGRPELKAMSSEAVASEHLGLKDALIASVSELFGESGMAINRGTGLCLSIPDKMAKVTILELSELPEDSEELDALIRWKGAKTLYMEPSECSVGYELLSKDASSGNNSVLVVASEKTFTAPIEEAFKELGLDVPYINIHSINVLNLLARELKGEENLAFIIKDMGCFVMIIVRNGVVDFYRFKELSEASENTEFLNEVSHSLSYYIGKNKGYSPEKLYILDAMDTLDDGLRGELQGLLDGAALEFIGPKTFIDAPSINLPSEVIGVMGAVGALLD